MTIYIEGHTYHYEMENLVRLFYPNEKITVTNESPDEYVKPYIFTSLGKENGRIAISVTIETECFSETDTVKIDNFTDDVDKTCEREMAVCLYDLLCRCTGKTQPWGILTGVRPIKLFRRLSEQYGEK